MTRNFRNTLICLALIFLMLSVGGCSNKEKNKWTVDGKEVTINQSENIITYDNEIYTYEKNKSYIQITYPNKMVYREEYSSSGISTSTWSADPNLSTGIIDITTYGYLSERMIIDTILKYSSEIDPNARFSLSGRSPILGFIITILGAIVIIFPKGSWYLNYGWRYKNSEPSKVAINVQRVSGAIAVIVGLLLVISN